MTDEERKAVEELEKAKRPDDEDEEEEEGEEEEEKSAKSEDLTEDDLEKSLGKLTDYVESGDVPTRKQSLLEKAQKEELTKAEQDELFEILGSGEKAPEQSLSDEVEKAMEPSDDLQKALDVSEYLNETHEEAKRINTMLADRIEKSDSRQHEFNLLLAKAVAQVGQLTKAMSSRLGVIEDQPAREPKSQGTKPLEKGFANTEPGEDSLSKSDILDTMGAMIRDSVDKGQGGAVDGIDLLTASAKYEQFNQIHPSVLAMVQKKKGAVQH